MIVRAAAALGCIALLAGCDSDSDSDDDDHRPSATTASEEMRGWVGKNVRVQFRRDALGAGAALPISPTTSEINGAATAVSGELMKVEANGIVIGPEARPRWIPREVILYVEANP